MPTLLLGIVQQLFLYFRPGELKRITIAIPELTAGQQNFFATQYLLPRYDLEKKYSRLMTLDVR